MCSFLSYKMLFLHDKYKQRAVDALFTTSNYNLLYYYYFLIIYIICWASHHCFPFCMALCIFVVYHEVITDELRRYLSTKHSLKKKGEKATHTNYLRLYRLPFETGVTMEGYVNFFHQMHPMVHFSWCKHCERWELLCTRFKTQPWADGILFWEFRYLTNSVDVLHLILMKILRGENRKSNYV